MYYFALFGSTSKSKKPERYIEWSIWISQRQPRKFKIPGWCAAATALCASQFEWRANYLSANIRFVRNNERGAPETSEIYKNVSKCERPRPFFIKKKITKALSGALCVYILKFACAQRKTMMEKTRPSFIWDKKKNLWRQKSKNAESKIEMIHGQRARANKIPFIKFIWLGAFFN